MYASSTQSRACVKPCVYSDSILCTFETSFSYSIILPFPLRCDAMLCDAMRCVPSSSKRPSSSHTLFWHRLLVIHHLWCTRTYLHVTENYVITSQVKIKMSSDISDTHTHTFQCVRVFLLFTKFCPSIHFHSIFFFFYFSFCPRSTRLAILCVRVERRGNKKIREEWKGNKENYIQWIDRPGSVCLSALIIKSFRK